MSLVDAYYDGYVSCRLDGINPFSFSEMPDCLLFFKGWEAALAEMPQYELLEVEDHRGRKRQIITLYNTAREQYEVYTLSQSPKVCPMGVDFESLEYAIFDFVESEESRDRLLEDEWDFGPDEDEEDPEDDGWDDEDDGF